MRQSEHRGQTLAAAVGLVAPLQPRAPRWVEDAIARASFEMFTAVVPAAAAMPAETLRARVSAAYSTIGDALRAARKAPVRLWNYLPDPAHVMGPGLDRYMVFNAGRYDGYRQWRAAADDPPLATASGVGISGDDLTIHCLASPDGGMPVENPRQTSAWQYSARYGPLPPCFARATAVAINGRPRLLIGGTASIVGEDSRHARDIAAQLEETLVNLAELIRVARHAREPDDAALQRLIELRVYIVRADDAALVGSVLGTRCRGAAHIELTTARLCRPELLVELEGIAAI